MKPLHESLIKGEMTSSHTLVERLKLKRDLLEQCNPAHVEIRTALVITGGGMRGVFSGGVVTALQELGMKDAFDHVVGVSAGAVSAAYLLAGETKLGTSIYYENLTGRRFINWLRLGNVLDISFLMNIFRNVKPLNQDAIRQSRSRLHIGVTSVETGEGFYVNISESSEKDFIKLIGASSAVPELTKPVQIDSKLYSDGVTGCTRPVQYAVETLSATDVLVIHNQPLLERSTVGRTERTMARVALRSFSAAFREAHLRRYDDSDMLRHITYPDTVNIGVICPVEPHVGRLTTNRRALKQTAAYGRAYALSLLS